MKTTGRVVDLATRDSGQLHASTILAGWNGKFDFRKWKKGEVKPPKADIIGGMSAAEGTAEVIRKRREFAF